MTKFTLIDGVARNAEHPSTFSIPDSSKVAALKPGDFYKVGVEFDEIGGCTGERFWVQLTGRRPDGALVGEINNHLTCTEAHGLCIGDSITVEPRHVLDTTEC